MPNAGDVLDSSKKTDGHAGQRMPALVRWCFGIDFALALAYLVDSLSGGVSQKLSDLLHLEREGNLPTWYSSTQLFVVAALLGLFAYRNFDRTQRRAWFLAALPLVFLAMSIDEIAEIHEWLGYKSDALLPGGDRRNTPFGYTGVYMFLLGIPVLLFLLGLIHSLRGYFQAAPGVTRKYLIGAVLLMGGAVGVETVANFVPVHSVAHIVQVLFEELLEMLGVTVWLWATHDLLAAHGFKIVWRPEQ